MSEPIEVRLDPTRTGTDDLRRRLESAAAAMGARLLFVDEGGGVPRVGGRPLASSSATPPDWLLEAALLAALRPRHILFLCVANSARSQMAEGIASSLAPGGVRVSSAGSEPTSVRPEAVRALGEIGIDVAHHRSKGVDEVERPVDAVITLCAEEVCPVWLGDAYRLHWALPDPAAAAGDEEERLASFRSVRDGLHARLGALFARWAAS